MVMDEDGGEVAKGLDLELQTYYNTFSIHRHFTLLI